MSRPDECRSAPQERLLELGGRDPEWVAAEREADRVAPVPRRGARIEQVERPARVEGLGSLERAVRLALPWLRRLQDGSNVTVEPHAVRRKSPRPDLGRLQCPEQAHPAVQRTSRL